MMIMIMIVITNCRPWCDACACEHNYQEFIIPEMEILTSVSHKSSREIINVFLEEDQQVERSISFKTQGFDLVV